MPLLKNSEEARKLMECVRNARKQLPISTPVFKNVKDNNIEEEEIELPKDKFLLLLNIIMELQRDIDYLIEAHRKMNA
jgi:hypothetical protein